MPPIENIQPRTEPSVSDRLRLDHPELVDALRQGNVYEVLRRLPDGVTLRDIDDYLASQHQVFQNQVVQDYEVYAAEASMPAPGAIEYLPHDAGAALTSEDSQLLNKGLSGQLAGVGKAQVTGPAGRGGEVPAELRAGAESHLGELEQFLNTLDNKIMEMQMVRDMQGKEAELRRGLQRIMAMARAGQVDPEFILLALAKVQMTKNGMLFSWKSRRVYKMNEMMDQASRQLLRANPADQGYYGMLQRVQAETRSGGFQLQMEMSDMQRLTQNIAQILEFAQSSIQQINQNRREIVSRVGAR